MEKLELQKIANEVRKDILTEVYHAKSGHPGGSLSVADILTCLYFEEMHVDPQNPDMADRDRLVLSKGHAAPALYAVLAEKGYFPKEELKSLRALGSRLQGHPNMNDTPGVDMTSGSLGQGVSAAVGMALSAKLTGDTYRVYAVLGDGELEEGQVWEAMMFAGNKQLDNLVIVADSNGIQLDAPALQGLEVVKALGIACRSVAPRHVPVLSVVEKADPSSFYFEVDSIGLRSYAKKQTGRQRYSCKFLHTSSRTLQYL